MQNYDFYSNQKSAPNNISSQDFQYYNTPYDIASQRKAYSHKKAHRLLTIIIALIIMSFTAGLVVGIKFAGGENTTIIDPQTITALNKAAERAKSLVEPQKKPLFPKNEYPYAVKVGSAFSKDKAASLAGLLSKTGQRIIVANNNDQFTVYAGPYASLDEAKKSLKIIMGQSDDGTFNNAIILKR